MRVAVIGAGPIGVVAALEAQRRGHEVTVVEAGRVGDSLRRWGATRLFSPFAMNLPAQLKPLLSSPPADDALLTGPEMAERVLEPLAARISDLRLGHRVIAVGRARLSRGELAGHPVRFERPFKLLLESAAGETWLEADRVIDASGVYGQPLSLGSGGLPARGERALGDRPLRDLGRVFERRFKFAGRVLLIGHGHSAATAIGWLAERAGGDLRVTWAVRSGNARPCVEVADDPLPERRRVCAFANQLAAEPPPWLTVERRAHVESLDLAGSAIRVSLHGGRELETDELIALTGFRPDHSFLSELPLELAPATEGGAHLAAAVARVTDCLSVPCVKPADLGSGEPGFFFAGHKSYGRSRTFLLSTGYAQLAQILDAL
jgi:thioredoxin reductase